VLALLAAVIAAIAGEEGLTAWFLVIAGLTLLAVWAKWGFAPLRLLVLPVVPLVLVVSEAQGWLRAKKIKQTAA
jgi:hypothetical protein